MKKYFIYSILLALAGCFHDDEEQLSLDGVWISNCYAALGQVLYGVSTMTFSSPDLKQQVTLFSDSSCSQESDHQEEFAFTYLIGNNVITSGGIKARELISESKDATGYTIYSFIEDKLYFGNPESIESTDFPTKLEYSIYFTKQ